MKQENFRSNPLYNRGDDVILSKLQELSDRMMYLENYTQKYLVNSNIINKTSEVILTERLISKEENQANVCEEIKPMTRGCTTLGTGRGSEMQEAEDFLCNWLSK